MLTYADVCGRIRSQKLTYAVYRSEKMTHDLQALRAELRARMLTYADVC
jgi:hypothetical protein